MAWSLTNAYADLAELKIRVGGTSSICVIVLNSPGTTGWSPWVWDNTSMATPDDLTIVAPNVRLLTGGRWFKVIDYNTNNLLIDGMGINISGHTISVDDTEIMTVENAMSVIGEMEVEIHSMTPLSRKLTIAGIEYDLSVDRNFAVAYDSLTGKPVLFSGSYTDLSNKPTLFSGVYNDLTGRPVLFDGNYNSLTNKPTLFSGSYTDLTNKPTIPSAQVPSDWTATTGVSRILNKPTLSTVATSGSYSDLLNKPSIPTQPKEFMATGSVTANGNAVFYLTDSLASGGTATFTDVKIVLPIVNDSTLNYTYGWTLSVDKKTLTVNAKVSTGLTVLGLQVLGLPANVPNGTIINVLVKGI